MDINLLNFIPTGNCVNQCGYCGTVLQNKELFDKHRYIDKLCLLIQKNPFYYIVYKKDAEKTSEDKNESKVYELKDENKFLRNVLNGNNDLINSQKNQMNYLYTINNKLEKTIIKLKEKLKETLELKIEETPNNLIYTQDLDNLKNFRISDLKINLIDQIKIENFKEEMERLKRNFDNELIIHSKKNIIPKCIKTIVWITYIKNGENNRKGKCFCCRKNEITCDNFECGHVISEKDGGKVIKQNLRPICGQCNRSMSSKNMVNFIIDHNLWNTEYNDKNDIDG
jgi:5-methylcytosine-specific restriction endonuclease McrA